LKLLVKLFDQLSFDMTPIYVFSLSTSARNTRWSVTKNSKLNIAESASVSNITSSA
jgi:hypothetical protein